MFKEDFSASAIILAAGNSSRMKLPKGCSSKMFLEFNNRPCLFYTLSAFLDCKFINEIVIVCKSEHVNLIKKISKKTGILNCKVVIGGSNRQESVFNGFKNTSNFTNYLIIHDGARCLIKKELIEKVLKDAVHLNCCSVLGVPVKDTIKKVSKDGFVKKSLKRNFLWQIQTPQIIKKDLYEFCIKKAIKENKIFTDDSQLVEYYSGQKVHVVFGDYNNIKLTTKEDVLLIENALKNRIYDS